MYASVCKYKHYHSGNHRLFWWVRSPKRRAHQNTCGKSDQFNVCIYSNAGRKAKSGVVRQPRQLSLDTRTIQTLDAMGANNSELFETLLNQHEPFLNTWATLGYGSSQENEEE